MCGRLVDAESARMQVVIRVQGPFGPSVAAAFDDLEVRTETVVSGELSDDAALHGVLDRLRNLGIPIIDLKVEP
jgi:hypothetical protein